MLTLCRHLKFVNRTNKDVLKCFIYLQNNCSYFLNVATEVLSSYQFCAGISACYMCSVRSRNAGRNMDLSVWFLINEAKHRTEAQGTRAL